jgi:tetratricopeptide (TPR) repeat protein
LLRTSIIQHVSGSDPPEVGAARCDPPQIAPVAADATSPEQFVAEQLSGTGLHPLLIPLALHDRFVDADYLEAMAQSANKMEATRARIDHLLSTLGAAGLVRDRGHAVYELHPALTAFLRTAVLPQTDGVQRESWQRGFVDAMGSLADDLAFREPHQQHLAFHIHGVNFHNAMALAESLGMDLHWAVLTHLLADYAWNTHDLDGAARLFERLAEHWRTQGSDEGEAAACHRLGLIAHDRRDFQAAEKWYLRDLQIEEKRGNEHNAAGVCHQLGVVAQEQRDLQAAERWYLKSLEIAERLGIADFAAATRHQLGRVAQERRDFPAARTWHLKSLEIEEK